MLRILVLAVLLAACGGGGDDDDTADAPPGSRDATAIDGTPATTDALPASTTFAELSDEQIVALCPSFRDPVCAELPSAARCPPACDPCAQPGWVEAVRTDCPETATLGDIATCVATLREPLPDQPAPCDGPIWCMFDVAEAVCR